MSNKQQKGMAAENRACELLISQGLSLLERNYRCRLGEIDLIMQDGNNLVFVEVRFRKNANYGSSAESVDARKQQKIIKATQHFLQANKDKQNCAMRFDVIAITGEQMEWIKDAFQAY